MPRFVLDSGKRVLTVRIDNDIVDNSDMYGWYFGGITPEEIDGGIDAYRGQFDTVIPLINSNGGSVTAGMAIRNSFIRLAQEGVSVEPVITGVAASIASVIALCGKKPKCYDGSYLMIHNPYTMTVGDAQELRNTADTLEKMRDDLISIYVKSSTMDVVDVKDSMDKETWFSFGDMVTLGFGVPAPVVVGAMNSSVNYFKSPFFDKLKSVPKDITNRALDVENKHVANKHVASNVSTDNNMNTTSLPVAGKKGESMSKLIDFLNANPDAKAEHDQAIASASGTAEVPTDSEAPAEVPTDAGKGNFKARAKGILNSSVYGSAIKALATDVLCGDADVSALNAAVASYDATMEALNSNNAQALTNGTKETPAGSDPIVPVNSGKIETPEQFEAYMNSRYKKVN